MKKLSIIAAWLCALIYFGIQGSATGVLQLSVVNSEGNVVLGEMLTIGESSNIDLSQMVKQLRPGFYFLQLANELGKIETFRFIKE